MTSRNRAVNRLNRLGRRNASPFSKPSLVHAARVMAPTLIALTFATAAHAQGTMDFSGATTLMGTFKTFAMYAGAVNLFRQTHKYQKQGEVTAKLVIPPVQIQYVTKIAKDGKVLGIRRDNPRFVKPDSVSNLLEEIRA